MMSIQRAAAIAVSIRFSVHALASLCLLAALAACGGGGEAERSIGGSPRAGGSSTGAQPPSAAFAFKCAPDNTLAHQGNGEPVPPYISGTLEDEKTWVRSYLDEAYLWYQEIPPADPSLPPFNVKPAEVALDNWFEALKSPALTSKGRKDRFSFTLPTAQWNALAQTGVVGGYGIEWAVGSATPPRSARVAYVESGTPAAAAGVARGDTMVALVSGSTVVDFANTTDPAEIRMLNESMFSPAAGSQFIFRLRSNAGVQRDVPLSATQVTTTPVKETKVLEAGGSKVGYLLFNDFILPGEAGLRTAMEGFQAAGVSDLILDLRYNGGGYLFIASQLAYMIASPARTSGKIFERSVYSDKRAAATASPLNTMPFLSVSTGTPGSGTTANSPLPNLGLDRVFVLTTAGTCSASESVINGLRGVDVDVIVIGASTCGKPYGFTAKDNCGLSYFPVEFQGVNQKGFGDFADGFAPTCAAADDLNNPLGSESEGLLAAALRQRAGAACTPLASGAVGAKAAAGAGESEAGGRIVRPPARTNKFLMR